MTSLRDQVLGRFAAYALCLPALVLALPSGPLADLAFATELTGTGWTTLLLLPAAVLGALLDRRRTAGTALLLAYWAWTVYGATRGGTDTLEADRALMIVAISGVSAIVGSGLNAAGRRALASGFVLVALVASLATLHLRHEHGDWAGPLRNSGETALVVLPGAVVGAWHAVRRTGWSRALGAAAFALGLVVLAAPPSLAALGCLALGAGLGAVRAVLSRRDEERDASAARRDRATTIALGGAAALALALFAWFGFLRPTGVPDAPTMAEQSAGNASGLAVRWMVVPPALELAGDAPVFGVGAGQFVARFPEVRDPAEIERSTHGRRSGTESLVEHPHDDVLLAFVESGVVGGVLLTLFLAMALVRAARAVVAPRVATDAANKTDAAHATEPDDALTRAALGAATIATLVVSLVWYPLTYLAPTAALAFAAMGALLREGDAPDDSTRRARRLVPVAAALLLCAFAPRAAQVVRHGRALASLPEQYERDAWTAALDAAVDARPDSATAHMLRAVSLRQDPPPGVAADDDARAAWIAAQEDAWRRVLALQPARFDAALSMGTLALRRGAPGDAAAWFGRARALDPAHPALLANSVRLAYESEDLEAAARAVAAQRDAGRFDALALIRIGADLLLEGHMRAGTDAFARADERFADLTGERATALENEYRGLGEPLVADALESLAHLRWADAQAGAGRFDDARRSLRQALRTPRTLHGPAGPPRLVMRLAATMYRTGRANEAAEQMNAIAPDARDWAEIPDWAGEALFEHGWGPGTAPR